MQQQQQNEGTLSKIYWKIYFFNNFTYYENRCCYRVLSLETNEAHESHYFSLLILGTFLRGEGGHSGPRRGICGKTRIKTTVKPLISGHALKRTLSHSGQSNLLHLAI